LGGPNLRNTPKLRRYLAGYLELKANRQLDLTLAEYRISSFVRNQEGGLWASLMQIYSDGMIQEKIN
jgi:hypothetical protein